MAKSTHFFGLGSAVLLALQAQTVISVPFNGPRAVSLPAQHGYTYQGCYMEPSNGRALETVTGSDGLTLGACADICAAAGKAYFGAECGSKLSAAATLAADDTECSFACPGNGFQKCGAGNRLSVYKNENIVTPAGPSAKAKAGSYVSAGCYSDLVQGQRALVRTRADDAMTPDMCATFCAGSAWMGVEYGKECWCGNVLGSLSLPATQQTDCNMACAGDSTSLCGGPARLNMYTLDTANGVSSANSAPSVAPSAASTAVDRVGDFIHLGCWTDDAANGRTFGDLYASDDMTIKKCADWAISKGYLNFGIEYSPGATIGDNSQLQTVDGKTVVDLTPPDNGQASVTVAAASAPDLQSEDSVVVQLTYKTEALKKRATKRAVLSECTLTMMIGSTVIYSSRIWTTDGSYTTVTSMPTSAGITTLIIVQYCPATAVPIVIGDVAVAPAPSSSSASSSSTVIVSSTVVIIQATPSTPSTSSSRLSSTISNAGWATYIPPATTNAPSTTAAPAATNAAANVPTYLAGVYQAGTCSSPGYMSTCTMSGMPVATIDIVGKATASPVPASGNMQQAYEQCAGICANLDSCNSWALDRGVGVYPDATASIWWCYFYSGQVGKYHPNAYNAQFAAVVYFAKTCYSCQQRDLAALAPAPAAATTSTTSSSSTSVPAVTQAPVIPGVLTFSAPAYDSAACTFGTPPDCYLSGAPVATSGLLAVATGITGFVSSEGPFKHSTKAVRPGAITPFSWIPTLAVPTTVTETNCPRPTADNWYTAGCTLSGGVLQTSGLVAVATGVPAPRVQNSNLFEYAYQACAQMCASMSTCYSWALDRGFWPADYSDWTCYFYSAGARLMTPQNDGNYWIVWMDKQCYACSTPAAAISSPTPSTSSSIAPAATSSSNAVSSTTAPATTRPPSEAYVFSASAWTSGTCVTQRNNDGATPCALSGWPTPTSQSGLLAVATGIAPAPSGVFDFSKPFEVCAGACRGVNGCTTWAIDRGNWPTDLSPWSCYMYNFVNSSNYNLPGNYFRLTSYGSAYAKFAWGVTECYNCTLNQAIASSVSSSSGYPTATQGLIAVATGIAPNVLGDYNFDPSYQRCAVICAGISGCQGYALDRTSTVSWNCNFYSLPVMTLLKSLSPSVDYRPVVWMSMLCHNCANIVPANVLSSSSSSFSSSSSSSSSLPLFVGYPQATASPTSTTPASSKSQSAASSSTSAAAAVCSRAASPPATANCNVKGFQQPAGGVQGSYLYAQTDCAAYCLSLGAACKSWTWVPGSGWCGIYSLAVWDAIGDSAVAGRAYKDNVMDEPACWSCPDGAAAHYLPV
ncbi:WSC domain-containing protein [Colletotrichum sp. SAR 10_71]|nr:WSC domain-containing protein [Colletotrichum sp. SAR 10_71]